MNAAILAVGSELLGSSRMDTNSLGITHLLERYGISLAQKTVVGDSIENIARELRSLLALNDVLILTGGLGPTDDDVTKDAVALAFGLHMVEDAEILADIEQKFSTRGLRMPSPNRRQALVFAGQRTLPNPRGTAPGFHLSLLHEQKPRHVWIFPGVPYELEGFLETDLEPWLKKTSTESVYRRVIKLTGLTESGVEEKLGDFYENHKDQPITILASRGEIQIHVQAVGTADEAYPTLVTLEQELREIFGDAAFGLDDDTLEAVVGRLLVSKGATIATAESCTGGLLASRLTDVSGSSSYFMGGAIAYSRQAKLFLIGIDPEVIDSEGEVSESVAIQMAQGVRRRFSTTYGVGITGIAGPTGGTASKPVGTVHVAVADQKSVRHKRYLFAGSRELIKYYSTQMALNMVRLMIVREKAGVAAGRSL